MVKQKVTLLFELASCITASGASAASKFQIDSLTGQVRVGEPLDYDAATGGVSYYDLTVTATDKGATPRTGTKNYRVNLQDENDNVPVFVDFTWIADVPENKNIGDVITTLTLEDDDGDAVTASLVDGDVSVFSISGSDVTLAQALDYETSAGHVVVIRYANRREIRLK